MSSRRRTIRTPRPCCPPCRCPIPMRRARASSWKAHCRARRSWRGVARSAADVLAGLVRSATRHHRPRVSSHGAIASPATSPWTTWRVWSDLFLDHLTVRWLHREAGAVGEDLLDLEKVVQPVVAELSTHAALLVPAPDAFHGLRVVVPDPDRPGADSTGHTHRALVVSGPHAGHESEIHRVRQLDRFTFALERRRRHQ